MLVGGLPGRRGSAPPVGGGSLSVTEWPRNGFAFDTGAWRGENNADIPVRITATAGEVIQARLVPTDGGVASAWTDVGTASGGADQLVGYLSTRKRSSRCLLNVRLKNAPATTAITTNAIEIGHIVAVWGQSEHAQWNVPAAGAGTPPTPETLAIRNAVDALQYSWACGRRSNAALKVPGVDAFPTGVSRTGNRINIGPLAQGLVLEDWDFSGHEVYATPGSHVAAIRNCLLGESAGLTNCSVYIFAEVGSIIELVEYNDVFGWDGLSDIANGVLGADKAIRADITGSGAGIQVGDIYCIRRNRFKNLPADTIKLTGCQDRPQIIEWNYFGEPLAYGNDQALHDMGRTYVYGEVALDGAGEAWICKVATSLGVAPVGGSPDWSFNDPHSDTIQTPAAKNGAIIRHNYFNQIETPRNRGLNGTLYLARDANANDRQYDQVRVEWNILNITQGTNGSSIIAFIGSGTNWTRPMIRNNWIGRRAASFAPYLKNNNTAMDFGGNIALDTGLPITAASISPNMVDTPALPEFADGRVTHWWHDPTVGAGAAGVLQRVSTNATPYAAGLSAITNAVLSVVGDDFVTFVHHTATGTTFVECLNDDPGRPWNNDFQLHQTVTGSGLCNVGVVYSSWYAAPSGFSDDYGEVWIGCYLGKDLSGNDLTTPATINYGFGSSVTIQRTFALLYDWTYTKAILPDAHRFDVQSGTETWSESNANLKNKRRCTESIRLAQELAPVAGFFAPRPFAPNAYHNGFPSTAGNYDPAGVSHSDEPHPNRYADEGQNKFARMTAYAILQAGGLLPIPVPEFDEVTLKTDLTVMRVGSTAGPVTTTRAKNSETLPTGQPYYTEVACFEYGSLPVHQADLGSDGKVYVYPRSGSLPTSGMTFAMGGASGTLIKPGDNVADLERDYPIVDFNLFGIDGVPVRQVPTALQGTHPTGTFTVP